MKSKSTGKWAVGECLHRYLRTYFAPSPQSLLHSAFFSILHPPCTCILLALFLRTRVYANVSTCPSVLPGLTPTSTSALMTFTVNDLHGTGHTRPASDMVCRNRYLFRLAFRQVLHKSILCPRYVFLRPFIACTHCSHRHHNLDTPS